MNAKFKAGTWADKIFNFGQEVFEKSSNKDIANLVGCDNQGIISRERKAVAEKTGWSMPVGRAHAAPAAVKLKGGSFPAKVQGFLEGTLDEVPDAWEPSHVYHVIDEDSVAWNRFIRRMADLDESMIVSFERWLGRGATLSRQSDFDAVIEAVATWDRKARAEELARELAKLGYGDKSPSALLRELWI